MNKVIVLTNPSVTLGKEWKHTTPAQKEVVNILGQKVTPSFQGRKYEIVCNATRTYPLVPFIIRFVAGLFAVLGTLGIALLCDCSASTVKGLFDREQKVRYIIEKSEGAQTSAKPLQPVADKQQQIAPSSGETLCTGTPSSQETLWQNLTAEQIYALDYDQINQKQFDLIFSPTPETAEKVKEIFREMPDPIFEKLIRMGYRFNNLFDVMTISQHSQLNASIFRIGMRG